MVCDQDPDPLRFKLTNNFLDVSDRDRIDPGDVAALCLAGALGEHVRAQDLETLGFLPSALAPRLRAVGNASLDGAALLARNAQMRENLAALCATARLLPLVEEKNFHQNYLRHMRFGA